MENSINPYLVIDEAEKGFSLHLFDDLVNESGYSRATIADLIGIDVRTVSNYKKMSRNFENTDAEHLIKLKTLFGRGKEVFGDAAEFRRWLVKPSYGLGGRIPEQLLKYISGIDLVTRELIRIEYGDFS